MRIVAHTAYFVRPSTARTRVIFPASPTALSSKYAGLVDDHVALFRGHNVTQKPDTFAVIMNF